MGGGEGTLPLLCRGPGRPPLPGRPLLPWRQGDPAGLPGAHLPGRRRRPEPGRVPSLPRRAPLCVPRYDADSRPDAEGFVGTGQAAPLPCLLLLPQVSPPLKATYVLQATGVQVVGVPFPARRAPSEQSRGHRPRKAVSSVPLATTARGPSCRAMPACLRSPAELGSSAPRVSLPVLPSSAPALAPAPSPCPPPEALHGALHTGVAATGRLPSLARLTQVRLCHLALLPLPQVLWLRSRARLAPTAGPRLEPPHSAPGAMPALPAPPPTRAQGSCEYPTPTCMNLSTRQSRPPTPPDRNRPLRVPKDQCSGALLGLPSPASVAGRGRKHTALRWPPGLARGACRT